MKRKDLTVLKQEVLCMLPITQTEIGRKLEIGRGDSSRLVRMMVKEGLVIRMKKSNTFLVVDVKNGNLNRIVSNCLKVFFEGRMYGRYKVDGMAEYMKIYKRRIKNLMIRKKKVCRALRKIVEIKKDDKDSLFSSNIMHNMC